MSKKRLIIGFVILNAILAVAILSSPLKADLFGVLADKNCCQGAGPEAYCCIDCCVWFEDCDEDEDCRPL